jgi:S1-C subfamily serine protease
VFARNFDEHLNFLSTFHELAERERIRKEVASLHNSLPQNEVKVSADLSRPSKILRDNRFKILMAAASVALVAVLTTVFTLNYMGMLAKKQQSAYTALRRDVERIKHSQKAIINDLNDSKVEPVTPVTFSGTGFAITSDGLIITSYHVVSDADSVFIENEKFSRFKLEEVAKDKALDIAILKIVDTAFTGFAEIPFGIKKQPADLGEKVYTLGFPRDEIVYGEGTVSSGSGYEGDTSAYQVSLPVNPGNSGGPLFDEQGNLLGVVSGKNSNVEGAAFATKSKLILDYLAKWDPNEFPSSKFIRKSNVKTLKRTEQLKKMKDYIFVVKVYNNKI